MCRKNYGIRVFFLFIVHAIFFVCPVYSYAADDQAVDVYIVTLRVDDGGATAWLANLDGSLYSKNCEGGIKLSLGTDMPAKQRMFAMLLLAKSTSAYIDIAYDNSVSSCAISSLTVKNTQAVKEENVL